MEVTSVMKSLSKVFLLSLVATAASAAGSSTGFNQVQQFQYAPSGIVHVWFDVRVITGAATCATHAGNEYPYTFDSTTAGGKSMLAGLLAANSAGVAVWVFGTGTCDVEAGYETLATFSTQNP
jgi:hypothetical protein